jgi:ABC-2 type transport system ATP-binding protein
MKNNNNKENRDYAVEFAGLTKKFNGFTAVDQIDLKFQSGRIFGLLGPNGSGKTTTIKMAAGLTAPTSGEAFVYGHSITKEPLKIKQKIGVVPEDLGLFQMLSPWEHLQLAGPIYGLSDKEVQERGEQLFNLLDLWQVKDKNVAFLSFGTKKKLSIAMSLLHAPSVLFLDEPFKGIDPVASRSVRELLLESARKGVTIFLTTHLTAKLEQLIDQYAILVEGKIVHQSFVKEDRHSQINLEDVFFRFVKCPAIPPLEWINN